VGVLVPRGRTALLLRVLSSLLDTGLSQLHVTCSYRMYKIQFPTHFTGGIGSIPRVDRLPRGTTFSHSSFARKITHLG